MKREGTKIIVLMLRLLRVAANKRQQDIARALGYAEGQFAYRVEKGEAGITSDLIQDWVDATGGIRMLDRIEEGCRHIRTIYGLGREPLRFA